MTALVESGTKAGVRTSPCWRWRVPVRAREPGSRVRMANEGRSMRGGDPNAASPPGRAGSQGREGLRCRGYAAFASSSRGSPLMAMRRGLRCSGLGIRTSSTPSVNCAAIASASTPLGSVSERLKAPNARSTR